MQEDLKISELSIIDFLNVFSVPVALGSVSTSFFFSRYFLADVSIVFYWLLGSSIWIVYTMDHLIDGSRLKDKAVFLRHKVHYTYRSVLWPILLALVAFNIIISFLFASKTLILSGLVIGGVVGIYFLITQVFAWVYGLLKEIVVAVVVAFGMVVMPALEGGVEVDIHLISAAAVFICLNLTNLLIFSYFDFEGDKEAKLNTSATDLGAEAVKNLIYNFLASGFVLFTIYLFLANHKPLNIISLVVAVLMMLNMLLFLMQFEEKARKNNLFRLVGDSIYLLPGLVILILHRSF